MSDPAGTRYHVGLGITTVIADLDFETYSEAGFHWGGDKWHGPRGASQGKRGLPVVGAAVYAEHPSTDALCLAFNLKDGLPPEHWRPDLRRPERLIEHVQRGGLLEAWNSGFEWWIWNQVMVRRYGWPELPYTQLRCAMAKARASGYPGRLGDAAQVMGLATQKDKRGDSLLKRFSMPQQPTAKQPALRITPQMDPVGAAALYEYNFTDIASEAEASARCPDLEGEELEFWLLDQKINRRGVYVDDPSLESCCKIVERCLELYDAELRELTGGVVERASQLERLKGWLAGQGVHMGAMDEEGITVALARIAPPPPGMMNAARRGLELRQLVGSASVKKVFAMRNQLSSRSRLHDLFNYHGARTGRPTGEGPQPTNLPRSGPTVYRCVCGRHHGTHVFNCPWCGIPCAPGRKFAEWSAEAVEDCLEVIRTNSLETVQWFFGDAMLCVSGCLRGLFIAAPGHDLIASDFSAIESVVTAMLAGEQWRIEMFRTHGKNYEMAAAQIAGIPFADFMAHAGYDVNAAEWWKQPQSGPHHPLRQTLGKVSELASGFGGWLGAWLKFGAGKFMSEEAIKDAILKWRAASPAIVEFWGGQERREGWHRIPDRFGLEGAAMNAVEYPGQDWPVMRKDGTHTGVTYRADGEALYCTLPSGRHLTYRNPRLEPNSRPHGGEYQLAFEGWNSNALKGAMGWQTMYLYGGLLCENVVQAVARDLQRAAMLGLEAAGYSVVLHVYDEDVCEIPHGFGSVEEAEAIMMRMPAWAAGWPIKVGGGWRGRRYRKG